MEKRVKEKKAVQQVSYLTQCCWDNSRQSHVDQEKKGQTVAQSSPSQTHTDAGTSVVQRHVVIHCVWGLRVCILTSSKVRLMMILLPLGSHSLSSKGLGRFVCGLCFVCGGEGEGMVNSFKAPVIIATFILGCDTLKTCLVSNLSLIQICAEHMKDETCTVFRKCYKALFLETTLISFKRQSIQVIQQ